MEHIFTPALTIQSHSFLEGSYFKLNLSNQLYSIEETGGKCSIPLHANTNEVWHNAL